MDFFTEGQKIALIFQKKSKMVEMICSIEKVSDDRLNLILPQYFMRYVEFLQVGKKLTAKAFSKLGTIDFNTIVISSPMEEYFTIELDYNSIKLTSNDDISVVRAIENLEIIRKNESFMVKTIELSTGFVKFTSNNKLAIEEVLECNLKLPKDYGIINFKATVFENDPIYTNEYSAVYTTMTEKARQALLYYMYVYSNETD